MEVVADVAAAVGRRLELLTIGRLGGRPFSVGMDANARPAPKATGRSQGWRRAGAFWVGIELSTETGRPLQVIHTGALTTGGAVFPFPLMDLRRFRLSVYAWSFCPFMRAE